MSKANKETLVDERTILEAFVDTPNQGLATYLGRVKVGNSDTYRTKFYNNSQGHKDVERILGDWDATLKSIKDRYPEMYQFEVDLRKKVGPLSVMLPLNDRLEDIDHYYEDILLSSRPINRKAISAVLDEWAPQFSGLRLNSRKETIRNMRKSTNSGLPFFGTRSEILEDTESVWMDNGHMYGVYKIAYEMESGHSISKYPCAVLGWRGQEGGPSDSDVKQRVIWMFPMEVNIRELQVYQSLITHCQVHSHVPAWVSMDAVDKEITALFESKGADDLVICTDFTKFDQHFNEDMADAAYDILSGMFAPTNDFRNWSDYTFDLKYNIPLMLQEDLVYTGRHGMGSGSGGTNADETLAHRALQHEAALDHHSKLNPHSMCLGDDGILSYPGITVDDVIETYTSHGQEMNVDKQYASTHDCTYLRRWHGTNYKVNGVCVGVYSTFRALGRLIYQERFYDPKKWSPKMVALRQLSIIENCKHHPLFEEFVRYCMKGDKYRLGLDIPGFLDDIDSIAQKAHSLMPNFLSYTQTLGKDDNQLGLSSWRVVQYLKSLRNKNA